MVESRGFPKVPLIDINVRSYFSSELSKTGTRVVLANGIPDHPFERDALKPNPNRACQQRWSNPIQSTHLYHHGATSVYDVFLRCDSILEIANAAAELPSLFNR